MAQTKKVKMRFNQDMYYTDKTKPLYLKDKVYEIDDEGKGMIQRWVKRGGVIVDEKASVAKVESVEEKEPKDQVDTKESVDTPPEKVEDVEDKPLKTTGWNRKGKR